MTSKNIVIAEDDTVIRLLVFNALKHLGHDVHAFENGGEAFQFLTRNPASCDILVTDHSMPQMTGLELVGRLRQAGFVGKIIVISGSLTPELENAYRAKQVNRILQKPFKLETLTSALQGLFEIWEKDNPQK